MDLDDDCMLTPDETWNLLQSLHTFTDADLDRKIALPIPEADQHIWNVYDATIPKGSIFTPTARHPPRSQMTDVQRQIASLSDRIGEARSNNQPDQRLLSLLRRRHRLYRRRLAELIADGNLMGAGRLRSLLATTPEQQLQATSRSASR